MRIDIPYGTNPRNERQAIVLAELLAMTATTQERRSGHWIPVPSRYWRTLIGSRYEAVLREAIEAELIEANDRYSVGRFPKSYRLAQRYRRPRTSPYELIAAIPPTRIRIAADDRVGLNLVAQFSRVRLSGHPIGWNGYCASQIQKGTYYAVRCQYGRFHTSFTGLSKEVRSTLSTVDGDGLVEIDVRNCQPLIVGVLASQQHTTTTPHIPPYTICGASDVSGYLELCTQGRLYEHLWRRCEGVSLRDCIPAEKWHRHASDRPVTPGDVKRQFLVMLFADPATTRRIRLFDVMSVEFPTVANFILESKRDSYQDLARRCQRLESKLIIDGACGAIFQARPAAIILTVHDAILSTPSDADQVVDLIRTEFARLGVTPSFRIGRNSKREAEPSLKRDRLTQTGKARE